MKINKKNNNLITKTNGLIEASYNLTALEKKVVLLAIRANKNTDKYVRMKLKYIQKYIGAKSKNFKKDFDITMRNILKKMIKIEINDTWLRMPWFAAIVIDNDYVVFEFSDTMNKFLYNLKKGFTMYHISMILKLSKFSSIRLYELFKKYEKLQTFNYPLEKLKMITGHEGKYEQYKSYKQKILIPSIEEVNNCTDLLINFSENKERHRVVGIKFFIEGKRSIRYEK